MKKKLPARFHSAKGISFIEVMVTLSVFSLGFVGLLNVYRVSINRMNHLTVRLYAQVVLDNRLIAIERSLRAYRTLPLDVQAEDEAVIGSKTVVFDQSLRINAVDDFLNLFSAEVSLSWREGQESRSLTGSRYISNFHLDS
jgi:type II secretory pathway component PulJ